MIESNKAPSASTISAKEISLPKGGGAIRGLGDGFQPNLFSGAGSYSIPVPVTAARGLEPQLTISYSSGAGNGEFGSGFSLSVPKIYVNTNRGIPQYRGDDYYVLEGEGELVRTEHTAVIEGCTVTTYLPRIEASYSKIELWKNNTTGTAFWKVVSRSNVTTLYGKTENARIADPVDNTRIFKWFAEETFDAKGNKIVFKYKGENADNVPPEIYEKNRNSTANKYVSGIQYGNYFDATASERFAFELVFDYGEYDLSNLGPGCDPYTPVKKWACRPDPFSSYRSGFEIRTHRLCQNVLLFHNFINETGDHCLVKRLALSYDHVQPYGQSQLTTMSLMKRVVSGGYRKNADGSYREQTLPPLIFNYSRFNPPASAEFKTLDAGSNTIPGYLDASQFLPVDLKGDGLPGFLLSGRDTTLYFEPMGDGKFLPASDVGSFPINKDLQRGRASLTDLEGNGELELLVNNGKQTGYYQLSDEGWNNFKPFSAYPLAADPATEMIDLNADGKTDLLLARQNDLLINFSKGGAGYDSAVAVQKQNDFPLRVEGDAESLVTFIDLFGDGLRHRVRIRSGLVECWPNSGYGRFGEKITLANAPVFAGTPDNKRVFFADIDGSGTSDLVYVYPDRAEIFINQNGNSFSSPVTINLPEQYSAADQISFADILGNGTSCLVFTKMAPVPRHYYYNFVGETVFENGDVQQSMKPYLMNEINNNLGLINQTHYCSATKFALQDKAAGRPWVTKLKFPVQVVERTVALDMISGSRFVTQYRYHDGFYDAIEKEFRGFGLVESWDTETFEQYAQRQSNAKINEELYVPPVHTKTWYHTGAFKAGQDVIASYRTAYFQDDSRALNFPASVLAGEIYTSDAETFRQAYGALKGKMIRKEVYSEDGTPLSRNPYTVEESNFLVTLKQAADGNRYAAFVVSPRESISYNYERNADDPVIRQEFVLDTDPLSGEIQKSCAVFLPRRDSTTPGVQVYTEQQQLKIIANTNLYFNTTDQQDFRLRGVLYDAQQFEVNCNTGSSHYFSYDVIKAQVLQALQNKLPYQETPVPGTLQAAQLAWTRMYFWNDDQSDALPLGQVTSRALVHHQSTAAFTKKNITKIFGDKLTDEIIQQQGGYFFDTATGYWHNKGLVQYYFTAPHCFYQPCKTENPYANWASSLHHRTTVAYDPYYFIPVSTTQYLDDSTANVVSALIDYTTLQPYQLTDINSNVSQVLFDCLGQVVTGTFFGFENDVPTGGMRLYAYEGQAPEYIRRDVNSDGKPVTFDDVLAHPEYYLQGATSFFFYDLNAYASAADQGEHQPVNSINLVRENYYHTPGATGAFSCQTLIEYGDGSGRSIAKKQQVDPEAGATEERWMVSGRTVFNNKGKVCQEYFPYFSNTPHYENQESITDEVLPKVTHYDPLLRIIRVDSPKLFFSKSEFTPWEIKKFDEDDTIKDSSYYKEFMANYPSSPTEEQRDEKDALDKAAVFYNTPAISVVNNTGNPFLNIQALPDRLLTGYQETDIQGRVLKVIDPRLYQSNLNQGTSYYNFKYSYAMGDKKPWYADSADAGVSMFINNIFGNAVQIWNANNYNTIISYDRLQRPLQSEVKTPDGTGDHIAELAVYGESVQVGKKNLRGQVYKKYDQAGVSFNLSCSMQGTPLSTSRQLAVNYKTVIDWRDPTMVAMEPEVYRIDYTCDALKRQLTEITPDETVNTRTYNRAGLLNTLSLTYKDGTQQSLISGVDYNANAQRTSILYQNSVKTQYTYEAATQRLTRLYTARTVAGKPVLQDIQYTYDPAGNITRSRDNSIEVVFCNNQKVEPLFDYTYNAIYQLSQATGRQHQGIDNNTPINGFKQSIYGNSCLPGLTDVAKLENYTERYTYDDGGNLVRKQHSATSSFWTQDMQVLDSCNRLTGLTYDASGNMQSLQLNNAVPLTWDYRNNLASAGIIQRNGEDDDRDYFRYDGNGKRIRKISERLAHGGSITNVEEKIYLGNYEIKRVKAVSESGEKVVLDRQCLRVMDNEMCVATVFYWVTDDTRREVDSTGTRSLRYQLANHLGSVSMEVDDQASIISYEEYFPYGGTAIIAGRSQREVTLKDYRYSGKECDDTTGLYYYGARYYVSWLGRWLSTDPSGPADGLNLFAFVRGNPVVFNDPNGMTREYSVTATTLARLAKAYDAIQHARVWIPFAGNVYDDVVATYSESTARLTISRNILQTTFGDNEVMGGGNNAFNRAASAMAAHGGACNEFSALTHSYIIGDVTNQPVMRVWDTVAHHSFTLIGDPRATPARDVIVADAWPSHYQVATLEHTRWSSVIGVNRLNVTTQTPLVGALQAAQNRTDMTNAYGNVPAASRVLLYDAAGATASVANTAGTAGRDDARGGLGGRTYAQYHTDVLGDNFLFDNDYSTVFTETYQYYHETTVVASRSLFSMVSWTNVTRTYHTGQVNNSQSWRLFR